MDNRGIKRNLVYSVTYQILVIILPFITAPYISRVLGAHDVGVYSYTQAFANYFYLFAMLGVLNYGNRTIAAVRDDLEELKKVFWEIFSFQFFMGILVSIAYVCYCICFVTENKLIYYMQFFYVISGVFDVNWFCFGLEKFKFTAIRSVLVRLGTVAAIFLFVKERSDLAVYTAILSVGNLIAVFAIWPFVLKYLGFKMPTLEGVLKHLRPNLTLFFPVIAVSVYHLMARLMLGGFSTEEEVGFYTYAERITQIPNTLILALNSVVMPRMANLYAKNDQNTTRNLMDRVMLFAMFMSALMAFGLAGVAPIFAPWFYGDEFTRCGLFIVLLCPIILFKGWAGVLRTQYIIPKGRDKVYIISLTTGAIVSLLINFVLIPKYNGIGAVIGTLGAELSVCLVQFALIRREIPFAVYLKDGLVFCALGFMMYIVINSMGNSDISSFPLMLIQIVTGTLIFLVPASFYCLKIKGFSLKMLKSSSK